MTLKKLLAGAMALVMTAAVLPMTSATAVTAPNDGYTYVYYENFGDSSATYDSSGYKVVTPLSNAMQRWDNKHTLSGSNRYMKYSIDSNVAVNTNNAAVLNTNLSGYTVETGKLYEASYKFAPSTFSGVMNSMQMLRFQGRNNLGSLDLGAIETETTVISGKEVEVIDFSDGKITIAGLDIILREVDGFITVQTFFSMVDSKTQPSKATTIVSYKKTDKTEVTHTEEWTFQSYVTIGKLSLLANNFKGMYIEEYSGKNGSGEFWIDDIYIREIETYDVTFDNNRSGDDHETKTVQTYYDHSVTPPDMIWEGHKIVGWVDENGDPFDLSYVSEGGQTAYAVWKETYKVTYDTMIPSDETQQYYPPDGEAVEDEWVVSPSPMTAEELLRSGWKFDGWYEGEEDGTCDFIVPFDPEDVREDKYVYAKWIQSHTVTFLAPEADTPLNTYSFAKDGTSLSENDVAELPTPVRETHEFIMWVTEDGEEFTLDTIVTEPIILTAVWEPKWKITFDTRGGEELAPLYVVKGESVDATTLPKATRKGFGFLNWYTSLDYTEADKVTGVFEVAEDMTLYAEWNNVLFMENFEYTSDSTRNTATQMYMAQLAPTDAYREELIEEGAGIVADPFRPNSGNHAFRVGAEGTKTVYKSFENADDGVYEISYKIGKTDTSGGGTFAAPRIVDHTYRGLGVGNTYMNYIYEQSGSWNTWIGGNMAVGWIDAVTRFDTINNTVSVYLSWKNSLGKLIEYKAENLDLHTNQMPLDKNGNRKEGYDGIDGIALISVNFAVDGVHLPVMSNMYVDDICVKKIDPPYIKEATVDGVTLKSDEITEKVNLSPNMEIALSEKVDVESITSETVYLTAKDSEVTIPVDREVVHGDTDSTIVVTPRSSLTYGGEYTLHITNNVKSDGGYFIDNVYSYDFKARPEIYDVEATLVKVITEEDSSETLEEVETLNELGPGTKLRATLDIENYAGDSVEEYFVSASIVNTTTGRQLAHKSSMGTINYGEKKTVISADFDLNVWLSDTCVVEYSIWRSTTDRTALVKMIELPQ